METVVKVDNATSDVDIPKETENLDGLKYLEGKTMAQVNTKAFEGLLWPTLMAVFLTWSLTFLHRMPIR
ncbi:hypothetical protein TUA1478L_23110 [Lactiplantibacillus plantarum]